MAWSFWHLIFWALGMFGITDFIPMFKTDVVYVNIGEIVLGGIDFLFMLYHRNNQANNHLNRENARQRKDISEQIKENSNQL